MDKLVEEKRLQKTLAIAENQIEQAKLAIEGKTVEIMEAKQDVRENTVHSVGSLSSSDAFEALVEMSQCMNAVTELIVDCEEEKRKILRLEKMMKDPYFARIDFRFEDEDEAEQVYIGRTALTEKATRKMYIYDWRSPIASVFYRFMTGSAFYEAPGGTIEGEVDLKRQYEIEDGKLEYFFDTDRNISDEFLRQMLSKKYVPSDESNR